MKKFFIVILLILLDFLSKKIVFNYLSLNSFVTILPILDLAHIHNYGIAFGLFSDLIPSWMIVIIGLFVTALIFYMMKITSNKSEKWGLILIIAGAIANIFDRGTNSYVIDFIYIHYKDFYWPAFNFADIYITFGVLIILYQIFKEFKKRIKKNVSN